MTAKLTEAASDITTLPDNSFAVLHLFISNFYPAQYTFAPLKFSSYILQIETVRRHGIW